MRSFVVDGIQKILEEPPPLSLETAFVGWNSVYMSGHVFDPRLSYYTAICDLSIISISAHRRILA
jgi:hypothetical protein